jgi:hypothetical protein
VIDLKEIDLKEIDLKEVDSEEEIEKILGILPPS